MGGWVRVTAVGALAIARGAARAARHRWQGEFETPAVAACWRVGGKGGMGAMAPGAMGGGRDGQLGAMGGTAATGGGSAEPLCRDLREVSATLARDSAIHSSTSAMHPDRGELAVDAITERLQPNTLSD
jgi:hypothetical protein